MKLFYIQRFWRKVIDAQSGFLLLSTEISKQNPSRAASATSLFCFLSSVECSKARILWVTWTLLTILKLNGHNSPETPVKRVLKAPRSVCCGPTVLKPCCCQMQGFLHRWLTLARIFRCRWLLENIGYPIHLAIRWRTRRHRSSDPE